MWYIIVVMPLQVQSPAPFCRGDQGLGTRHYLASTNPMHPQHVTEEDVIIRLRVSRLVFLLTNRNLRPMDVK